MRASRRRPRLGLLEHTFAVASLAIACGGSSPHELCDQSRPLDPYELGLYRDVERTMLLTASPPAIALDVAVPCDGHPELPCPASRPWGSGWYTTSCALVIVTSETYGRDLIRHEFAHHLLYAAGVPDTASAPHHCEPRFIAADPTACAADRARERATATRGLEPYPKHHPRPARAS